jgi:hypothetical protein
MLEGKQDRVTSLWPDAFHPLRDTGDRHQRSHSALQLESKQPWPDFEHRDGPRTKWRFATSACASHQEPTTGCHTIGLSIYFAMVQLHLAQQ